VLVFLDTEFTDFIHIDLISLALVSEDGHEFYAEVTDYRQGDCSAFAREAVLPQLGKVPGAAMPRAELAQRLLAWFAALPEPAEVIYDDQADWDLLADVLQKAGVQPNIGSHLQVPNEIATNRLFQVMLSVFVTPEVPRHHALNDARALRAAYLNSTLEAGLGDPPQVPAEGGPRTHQMLDQRSLAMHRLIAEKIRQNPELFEKARRTLARWRGAVDASAQPYLIEWERLFASGLEATLAMVEEDSERASALRQCSPFVGILPERERMGALKDWRLDKKS